MSWSWMSGSSANSFGMAWAATLRTYGLISRTDSLIANNITGVIICTLIEESTRRALAWKIIEMSQRFCFNKPESIDLDPSALVEKC